MEMEATWRRSTVETVLRCGLVIVNAFGRPLVSGFQSYFYFDCIDTDFRTGGGLSKEKAERCGHPDAAYLPSTGSILLSRMVLDHTNSVSKSSLDRS